MLTDMAGLHLKAILLAVTALTASVRAACSSQLLVDNFNAYGSNQNALESWTSDDGTMINISAASGKLSFTARTNSYFYTTIPCGTAKTDEYNAVIFTIKGPAGAQFSLDIQTTSDCGSTSYQEYHHTISGFYGTTRTIRIPFSNFGNIPSGASIKAFVWGTFSQGNSQWELDEIKFDCANAGGVSTTPTSTSSATATPTFTGTCSPLVVDDFVSQSRLLFLGYNALSKASGDDGSMASISLANRRLVLNPRGSGSYFFSITACVDAVNKYGGLSWRIKARPSQSFVVELQTSTGTTCGTENYRAHRKSSAELGWIFDGTERLYSVPLSAFTGADLSRISAIQFDSFAEASDINFGPIQFYCGNTVREHVAASPSNVPDPTATIPLTTGTATPFVIDTFQNANQNDLGKWHGGDALTAVISNGRLTITSSDTDYSYFTVIADGCRDMNAYKNSYLHIAYTGSDDFSVALQQSNSQCSDTVAPYPETWDEVDASYYNNAAGTDIYIPWSHLNINHARTVAIALRSFRKPTTPTVFSKIEVVRSPPTNWKVPAKIPSAPLYFACTRPNSFAFAVDDGSPFLAQEVMQIIKDEGITVTFFTVGQPLLDPSMNFTAIYRDMIAQGHQVALHSHTHPKLESLPFDSDIDWELQQDIDALRTQLGISSKYFRPPFGNIGATSRQRLEALIPGVKITMWSVDIEDYKWAGTATPEKQLEAFKRDVAKGGNLVVMHYLTRDTVRYIRDFIRAAKATGKQLMRVDQCMEDPEAPPLP